uniref:Uncharacterized protein n=1 Tax=Arundo donax TaxID=35708 RepID=A0A0A9F5X3_ARUDO
MTCTSNMSNWRFQTEWHHWKSARDSKIRKGTIRLVPLLPSITPVNINHITTKTILVQILTPISHKIDFV